MLVDTDTTGTTRKTRMRRQGFVGAAPPSALGYFAWTRRRLQVTTVGIEDD